MTELGALRIASTLYILIFETFLVCNLLFLFGKALSLTIFYVLKEAFFRWFFLESSEIIVLFVLVKQLHLLWQWFFD